MSDLRSLSDAFTALEERADAAAEAAASPHPTRRSPRSLLAPLATAGVVALAAVGIAIWQRAPSSHPAQPMVAPAVTQPGGSAPPSAAPSITIGPSPARTPAGSGSGRYQPPTTVADLAAKTRMILDGTATITVTGGGGQGSDPASSGSSILGQLTGAGQTGGYLLNVFAASRGTVASCESDLPCSVHHRGDGSTLAVGTYHDSSVPGGLTREVEFVRADGAAISLLLSTEADPKGQSTVTASRIPLTVQQIIDFVTSDRW